MPASVINLEIVGRDGKSRTVRIDRTPYSIGSDPSSDLRLPGVAPRHAQIVVIGRAHYLIALGDTGWLSIDDAPIQDKRARLIDGARIRIDPEQGAHTGAGSGGMRVDDRDSRAFMEIARTITSSLAIDEVLDRVLKGAVRLCGAERGYLFLSEGGCLVPWARDPADPQRIEVSRSVAEEVARTGCPVYRDRGVDEAGGSVTDSIVRLNLHAVLCVPLAVREEIIGVIYLDSRQPIPHQRPKLPLLEGLAGLAAIAIQNSRLVEERVRNERLAAIGEMATAIVHDLRNPLTTIRGYAEISCRHTREGDPAQRYLDGIIHATDRLTNLTSDLLQFSKKAPPTVRAPLRLADLVRKTIAACDPQLEQRGVGVSMNLDEAAVASADASLMMRLLQNLISNSLEAMPDGGEIHLACSVDDGRCLITVRDNGAGMTAEVRGRIFEPFFTHGKEKGTGLGLAIVKKIIVEHNGAIRVESEPGRGTTFSVELPSAA